MFKCGVAFNLAPALFRHFGPHLAFYRPVLSGPRNKSLSAAARDRTCVRSDLPTRSDLCYSINRHWELGGIAANWAFPGLPDEI